MPAPKRVAQPKYNAYFDAWNSSSTGHQRAENKLGGSTGWRESRVFKLSKQFRTNGTNGSRVSDKISAGSEDWDEKAKALIPKDARERSKISVQDMLLGNPKVTVTTEEKLMAQRKRDNDAKEQEKLNRQKGIFDGLVIYVNGSTHPHISDYKLKHAIAENGGRMSIHLGRRQVTHVILGTPNGVPGSGAGGGLAGGKMEKEIRRVGGCGVKYVGVEWVLQCLKLGRRLPEAQFSNLKIAAKGQQSVYGMFKKVNSTDYSEAY